VVLGFNSTESALGNEPVWRSGQFCRRPPSFHVGHRGHRFRFRSGPHPSRSL